MSKKNITLSCRALTLLLLALPLAARAGFVEEKDGNTIITVKCWRLPDPTRTDTKTRADVAVIKEFTARFPKIFRERYAAKYKADPKTYGKRNWDQVEIELQQFSGISIEGMGMDSRPLMAIAGGVAPDILYVNFRQSDTYIQEHFLYPLDKPEDGYMNGPNGMTEEEKNFAIHRKVWPVVKRKGPDGQEHIWAMPQGGVLGKVILYRKDLLDEAGIPYPKNDWTWEDFFRHCKQLTDPKKGTYGARFGKGKSESWYWITFLWSAGGEAMTYDADTDTWSASFNSRAAAVALEFYTRLCNEHWTEDDGRNRFGYAYKETEAGQKWELGQIGFYPSYIDEKLFSTINPDITGMVAVPLGYPDENGVRHRGAELNSRMQGIFSGVKDPIIRDAAWEYLKFCESKDAVEIRTRIMVEGGLGRFVNPRYLRLFGYQDLIRLAPKGWEETFKIAIETGKPEPYGRNCQLVYHVMTKPMLEAERLSREGDLPEDREARVQVMQKLLQAGVTEANEKMIGILTAKQLLIRRSAATTMLIFIVIGFALVFRKIIRLFTPPKIEGVEQVTWGFSKYKWAYVIITPAVLSIFFWRYLPLLMGSGMAFQNYRIMGGSEFVWVDNFANLLWDGEWWNAIWNSLRYSFLVVGMTFLPPVILAVLLQEIPRGKILFRTIFYLPAVITGLVVIYLWRSFYEKSEFGVLNAVVLQIPAIGFILIGLVLFLILFFFAKRLWLHESHVVAAICFLAGAGIFWFFFTFATRVFTSSPEPFWVDLFLPMKDPYEWLDDPKTAMVCCVMPMVWAGMGPGCLIYLAALKGVAPDFYEAADIDGATFIDKILFVVIPILKPLLIIQFIGVFIASWQSTAFILAMTGGSKGTEVAGLHIFYKAYMYLKFGPATAMAWVLGFMLIGFTVDRLRILSRLEFNTTGDKD
ncbi:MAG: extracellular solute-binding protein [Lentisphaeria bacterium]|nr:extracellular solute-binding protein [Lentisphaeria bacterium]